MSDNAQELKDKVTMAINTEDVDNIIDVLKTIESPYFAMDIREINKKYNKAFNILKSYLIENSNGAITKLNDGEAVMAVFMNSRILYDFFDSKNILIGIAPKGGTWSYVLNDVEYYSPEFKNRHDTEKEGFSKAFEILNGA